MFVYDKNKIFQVNCNNGEDMSDKRTHWGLQLRVAGLKSAPRSWPLTNSAAFLLGRSNFFLWLFFGFLTRSPLEQNKKKTYNNKPIFIFTLGKILYFSIQ